MAAWVLEWSALTSTVLLRFWLLRRVLQKPCPPTSLRLLRLEREEKLEPGLAGSTTPCGLRPGEFKQHYASSRKSALRESMQPKRRAFTESERTKSALFCGRVCSDRSEAQPERPNHNVLKLVTNRESLGLTTEGASPSHCEENTPAPSQGP